MHKIAKFKRVGYHGMSLPSRGSELASGFDLAASQDCTAWAGDMTRVGTGWAVEVPPGFEAVIRPRSGMSSRLLEVSLGTIDEDYRGEIKVAIFNRTTADRPIKQGDRIAQLIIRKKAKVRAVEVTELSATQRGSGGFGSTGR